MFNNPKQRSSATRQPIIESILHHVAVACNPQASGWADTLRKQLSAEFSGVVQPNEDLMTAVQTTRKPAAVSADPAAEELLSEPWLDRPERRGRDFADRLPRYPGLKKVCDDPEAMPDIKLPIPDWQLDFTLWSALLFFICAVVWLAGQFGWYGLVQ